MPTPSSNTPPPQTSTCPDDNTARPLTSNWVPAEHHHISPESHQDQEQHADVGRASPAPVASSSTRQEGAADAMIEDEPTSAVSSRSTTMSPGPESTATARTTPAASGEPDSVKHAAVTEDRFTVINGIQVPLEGASDVPMSGIGQNPAGQHPSAESSSKGREMSYEDVIAEQEYYMGPSMGSDYPSMRTIPSSPSSFLRPGSKFHGTQQSEKQVYDVQVEIKHVDLKESFLCGYLRIQGLTEDHPTLTTYFEGEIIGNKYSFFTNHATWGATDKIDLNHWGKFNAFRPYSKAIRKGPVFVQNVAQKENIFMRWKEHFLVPDHRVRTITGASFEGFYYICFNQVKGEVSGIYFHSKSEKFQQLELKHVEDKGCYSAIEFR